MDGITENNIITHPSVPRNKLIAETLQNLKYVQRTGQGVDIIFKDMVSMGKPYPRYRAYNAAVSLTIFKIQEMCGFTKQQARTVIDKMRNEELLDICRRGKKSYYVKL